MNNMLNLKKNLLVAVAVAVSVMIPVSAAIVQVIKDSSPETGAFFSVFLPALEPEQ